MNELELAERFNRELDGVFQEGKSVYFSPDPAAMDLAAELARADFSRESAIKESLRERLVPSIIRAAGAQAEGLAGGFAGTMRGLLRNVYARAALAAACLLLILFPILRRSGGQGREPGPAPAAFSSPHPTAKVIPATAVAARKPDVQAPVLAPAAPAAADQGVFQSIPMARLAGEPIQSFPIESAGIGTPIILAKGREVRLENGSGVVLETEHAVFTFERRVISPDELFERRSL